MKHLTTIAILSTVTLASPAANAASSDYYLKIEGVAGEAAVVGDIQGYSWGMSNPSPSSAAGRDLATGQASGKAVTAPRDAATGLATGKRMHKPMFLTGDLDGDGIADLADTSSASEIDGFSLTFDKASPVLARLCGTGGHFDAATVTMRGSTYELSSGVITACSAGSARIGDVNSLPNRISTNVSVPKQTQGASFGERCASGACAAPEMVTVTIVGQLKHTKTGHVTLMK